jgi:2-dehydropantoate 2-reductase
MLQATYRLRVVKHRLDQRLGRTAVDEEHVSVDDPPRRLLFGCRESKFRPVTDRCLVVGAGAIGAITGGFLARAGVDVVFVDTWHQNVERIRSGGLRVRSPSGEFTLRPTVYYLDEMIGLQEQFRVIFMAVKAYDTVWMTRLVRPKLATDGVIVSIQNGLNEHVIAEIVGPKRTVGCAVHMNGAIFEPALVTRYSNVDWSTFTVGELDGADSERLADLTSLMTAVGQTHPTSNIWGTLWSKLALNCMTNGLSGITGLTTRDLWTNVDAARISSRIGSEVARVATASGYSMDVVQPTGAPRGLAADLLVSAGEDPFAMEECVGALNAAGAARSGQHENKPSLLQDILKGRRTEIDQLNGYVSHRGAALGIATPMNNLVSELLKQVERGGLVPSPSALSRFAS